MRHFVQQGHQVSVLSPYDEKFFPLIESTGAKVYDLSISAKGTNPITDFKLALTIKGFMKQLSPDIAFFFTIKPNIYGGFAARMCHLPYIPVTTGLGYTFIVDNWISKLARKLYKYSFKGAQQVWFLNEDDRKDFLRYHILPESKTRILRGEGVDMNRFSWAPTPEKTSFLLMARMLWDKGVGEFVEAARAIKKEHPEVTFNLLGFLNVENPSAISAQQIKDWEKEGIVNYLGTTPDVVPFVRDCTAIVLPSYREGIPVTLLEAASMGRIVIATDTVGCRDTVDDQKTGFLCPVKDAKTLADCMRKVIEMTPEERETMGKAGRQKVHNEFDENLVFEKYDQVLASF